MTSVRSLITHHSALLDGVELVVKAVLDELGYDPERLRAALADVLPDYCGTILREQRNRSRITPVDDEADESDDGKPKPKPTSKRVARIRVWYQQYISTQLHVEGGWRRIGDCTSEDLRFAAQERAEQAAKTLATAAEYERLAEALEAHDAATVSELPPAVVRAAIDGTPSAPTRRAWKAS